MKPHKHAEVIKAWADGKEIQSRLRNSDGDWFDCVGPENPSWHELIEYRIKPEAPKWPVTRMTSRQLKRAFHAANGEAEKGWRGIANAAITRACQDGDLVPLAANTDLKQGDNLVFIDGKVHRIAFSDSWVPASMLEKVAEEVSKATYNVIRNVNHRIAYCDLNIGIPAIIASVKEKKK